MIKSSDFLGLKGLWTRKKSPCPPPPCRGFNGHRRRSIPVGRGRPASPPPHCPAGPEVEKREAKVPRAAAPPNTGRERTRARHGTARCVRASAIRSHSPVQSQRLQINFFCKAWKVTQWWRYKIKKRLRRKRRWLSSFYFIFGSFRHQTGMFFLRLNIDYMQIYIF